MMSAYYRRLTGDNEQEKLKCAQAWSGWEMATSRSVDFFCSRSVDFFSKVRGLFSKSDDFFQGSMIDFFEGKDDFFLR